MKDFIKKLPILGSIAKLGNHAFTRLTRAFPGSEEYWKQRYRSGGNSGAGSYEKMAEFKGEVLNNFVRENQIRTIIEYGCGDGNQLRLADYPIYLGYDVSPEAISRCREIFSDDQTKSFRLMNEYGNETAELTLSLDVIYHLIEDDVFQTYMNRLFDSSTRFVTIYSSNTNKQKMLQAPHVKHRKFSEWVEENKPDWRLKRYIPNRYGYTGDEQEGSFANFYIYEKA